MKETIMTHNSIHQSCFERGELELIPQTASELPQARGKRDVINGDISFA